MAPSTKQREREDAAGISGIRAVQTALFLLVLFLIPVLTIFSPKETTSYYENRSLAEFPALSSEAVLSGGYMSALEQYISDHLFKREPLLRLATRLDLELFRLPVISDVVVTDKALLPMLAWDEAGLAPDALATMTASLAKLNGAVEAAGGRLLYVGIPQQRSVMRAAYPAYLNNGGAALSETEAAFFGALSENGIAYINMLDVFWENYAPYYTATDHHYNLLGAYETYLQIADYVSEAFFPVQAVGPESLTFAPMDVSFLGSRNRKLFGLYPNGDILYGYTLSEPIEFDRWDNGEPVESTVFSSWGKNTYVYYMGGDIGETIIRTYRDDLPNALVIGDSFTNALETVLYLSFNETRSLDFRHYDAQTVYEYLEAYRPDVVIYVRDDTSYLSTDGNGNLG